MIYVCFIGALKGKDKTIRSKRRREKKRKTDRNECLCSATLLQTHGQGVSHLSGEYVPLCFPADLLAVHFLKRVLECQIIHPLHHLVFFPLIILMIHTLFIYLFFNLFLHILHADSVSLPPVINSLLNWIKFCIESPDAYARRKNVRVCVFMNWSEPPVDSIKMTHSVFLTALSVSQSPTLILGRELAPAALQQWWTNWTAGTSNMK